MIKLDLDDISYYKLLEIIDKIKQYTSFKEINVKSSPRLDGYHVRIKTFWKLKDRVIFKYRLEFGDDPKRLCRDMLNDNKTSRNILYNKKIKYSNNQKYEFNEVHMFTLVRNTPESSWQKKTKQEKIPLYAESDTLITNSIY
tara:strand:+ start:456 stop:881 length:426 start_codon:yes stop_codon:yes gene_type:complete